MNIPEYFNRDDYLQNPIMRRFLKENGLELAVNRSDYIKTIEDFANANKEQENIVEAWLLKIAKEGSKEFCYRKITGITERHRNPTLLKAKIDEQYPNCPMKNILTYHNTKNRELIEYCIITDETGETKKIEFTFSRLVLYGDTGEIGNLTVFPIFVEVYIDKGFIISRAKAKSTIYEYDEDNKMLFSNYKINTMTDAITIIDEIVCILGFEVEKNKNVIQNRISKMLYKLYQKYSFAPVWVQEKVDSMDGINKTYVDTLFKNLKLDVRNKERAILDLKILVEKYISINGNNEELFKKDRNAYLIKVSADDEIELTKIDATSEKTKPLQCTEAFFDSKKSVMKSKKCNKLNLTFKRDNEMYLKGNPLVVQFGSNRDFGYFKTIQYAEEVDIQHVLQTIFTNY